MQTTIVTAEVVENGYNGFLIPIEDTKALIQAMEKLIIDSRLRKQMGFNSRAKAEKEFDEIALVNRILSVYNYFISGANLSLPQMQRTDGKNQPSYRS